MKDVSSGFVDTWSPLFPLLVLRTCCVDHGPPWDTGMSMQKSCPSRMYSPVGGAGRAWQHLWSEESDLHARERRGAVTILRAGESGKDLTVFIKIVHIL